MKSGSPATPVAGSLRFRHHWRPYQQEILADFDRHIEDDHFHVVAAPGSGKTVLGLEVLRRLGQPAMVLAPTRLIRDQWIERLLTDFSDSAADAPEPTWISRDPAAPALWTFATYQGLAAAYKRHGKSGLVRVLQAAGLRVLVVDEAHHLRAYWWKCMQDIKVALEGVKVVALTATPPYDVPQAEWSRYASFCGAVDAEVSAPELVAAGCLCPHQDLVHFSAPLPIELAAVDQQRARVTSLFQDLCLDVDFAKQLFSAPLFREPSAKVLLDDLNFFLAAAIFFRESVGRIPAVLIDRLDLLDVELPSFDLRWMKLLLTGLLFDFGKEFGEIPNLMEWKQRLHEAGVLHRREVMVGTPASLERTLARSVTKLEAIGEILTHEVAEMGAGLRAVVLCDHIRERDFPSGISGAADPPFVRLGVVPAFDYVRRFHLRDVRPAILTGRLIVIPEVAREPFLTISISLGASAGVFSFTPLAHAPTFLRLEAPPSAWRVAVAVITRLFGNGEVTAIFGTAALLGEGWDAPAVNTLVIASTIGSFVSSNQMRGRAIRAFRDDPEKAANIWHLATLSDGERSDYEGLARRFEAFSGPAISAGGEPVRIKSGIARLLPHPPTRLDVPKVNALMFARASDRSSIRDQWQSAVYTREGRVVRPVREVEFPQRSLESKLFAPLQNLPFLWRLYRFGAKMRMWKMATVVFDALKDSGQLRDCPAKALEVRYDPHRYRVALAGRPPREQAVFCQTMLELVDPLVVRPRYLMVMRCGTFCVPAIFGVNARAAAAFSEAWGQTVGRHTLLFTSSSDGRKALLRLRAHALAGRPLFDVKIQNSWK